MHGVFRGGMCSLPITSPNLSFQQFLSRMNAATQIKRAEHELRKIDGHSIVSTKKKRLTYADDSADKSPATDYEYVKPATYEAFVKSLLLACEQGEKIAKDTIARLAPDMHRKLEAAKEWDTNAVTCTLTADDFSKLDDLPSPSNSNDVLLELTDLVLGPYKDYEQPLVPANIDPVTMRAGEFEAAVCGLIADISCEGENGLISQGNIVFDDGKQIKVSSALKNIQPHRECPSKDRSRRFAAGELPGNRSTVAAKPPEDINTYDVKELQFWAIHPSNKQLQQAKTYLLGRILCLSQDGKPCISSQCNNPNTNIVLLVYSYCNIENVFQPGGRTGLLRTMSTLISNVSIYIDTTSISDSLVQLDLEGLKSHDVLRDYIPFHDELDISSRLGTLVQTSSGLATDEETDHDSDLYLVEKIIKKRYNSQKHQYEYFVKWQGYSSTDNTWELPENIPNDMLDNYEQNLLSSKSIRKSGLRQNRKLISKKDFILNM